MKKKLILLGLVLCANLNMVAQHHEKKLGDFELVELVSQKLILFGTEHGHWHVAAGFEKETTKELSLEPVLVAELGYSWFSFTQKIREGGRFFWG